jgi:hypothetical protein
MIDYKIMLFTDRYSHKSNALFIYKNKKYRVYLNESLTFATASGYCSIFCRDGIFALDENDSYKWVHDRIVPENRQNIREILRSLDLEDYDPPQFMMKINGRCDSDWLQAEDLTDKVNTVEDINAILDAHDFKHETYKLDDWFIDEPEPEIEEKDDFGSLEEYLAYREKIEKFNDK